MKRRRPCLDCGAPTTGTRCPTHERLRDAARGSGADRGYDAEHRRIRAEWAPTVDAGLATCAGCGEPITSGTPWDLGHNADRTGWIGPMHATCNRATRRRP